MKKILCICLLFSCILCGCGNSEEEEEKKYSTLTGKELLVVGMECDYAPFNWEGKTQSDTSVMLSNDHVVDGYDVRLARYLATALNREIVIKKVNWDIIPSSLDTNLIDIAISGITPSVERDKTMDFSSPYYESEMAILVLKKNKKLTKIKDIQQLKGYKLCGQQNTNYDRIIDQIKGVKHQDPKPTFLECVDALRKKQVDAICAELPVALSMAKKYDDLAVVRFKKDKGFTVDTKVSIAFKEGSKESQLYMDIEEALKKLDDATKKEWMDAASKSFK